MATLSCVEYAPVRVLFPSLIPMLGKQLSYFVSLLSCFFVGGGGRGIRFLIFLKHCVCNFIYFKLCPCYFFMADVSDMRIQF